MIAVASVVGLLLTMVVANVAHGNNSAASGTVDLLASGGKVCALVVGISDYYPEGAGGPDLAFADDDADAMYAALRTVYGVSAGNITLLKNSQTTKSAIMDALDSAKGCTGVSDDLVVFISGHGTVANGDPDGDGEKKDTAAVAHDLQYIWDGELANAVSTDDARRKVVLLDISFPSGFNNDMQRACNGQGIFFALPVPRARSSRRARSGMESSLTSS